MKKLNRSIYQKLISFLERIGKIKKHFGFRNALHFTLINLLNRFLEFRIIHCISIQLEDLQKKFLTTDPQFNTAFLEYDELKKFCLPEFDMTESFVTEATNRGDRCFGIREKKNLVAYGWYSLQSTDYTENLTLSFSNAVYMYKGFVVKSYRGRGLHATGKVQAFWEYSKMGYKTMLSCVNSDNFASQHSFKKIGGKLLGKFFAIKIFGKYFTFRTRGCKKYDFKIYPKQI